jgi:predicted oxidoreductase (fatty acid repression mutant protein)
MADPKKIIEMLKSKDKEIGELKNNIQQVEYLYNIVQAAIQSSPSYVKSAISARVVALLEMNTNR